MVYMLKLFTPMVTVPASVVMLQMLTSTLMVVTDNPAAQPVFAITTELGDFLLPLSPTTIWLAEGVPQVAKSRRTLARVHNYAWVIMT